MSQKVEVHITVDDDDGTRSDMCSDFLYETFCHSTAKGFSWLDVCKAVATSAKLLSRLAGNVVEMFGFCILHVRVEVLHISLSYVNQSLIG